jgi:dCMP deaminase
MNQEVKFYKEINQENCQDEKLFRLDKVYLRMAKEWSENSYCKRSKVGCLVVKNKTIISDGYNGTPTGFPNECEDCDNKTLPLVLHAEANAITKLSQNTVTSQGSTMYITLSPCYECAKLIIQSGIKRIVFSEFYRITDSLELLTQAGIEIVYINLFHT